MSSSEKPSPAELWLSSTYPSLTDSWRVACRRAGGAKQHGQAAMLPGVDWRKPVEARGKLELVGGKLICTICSLREHTGPHYGVHMCEADKQFLKRTFHKGFKYAACSKRGPGCPPKTRGWCKACRLAACLSTPINLAMLRIADNNTVKSTTNPLDISDLKGSEVEDTLPQSPLKSHPTSQSELVSEPPPTPVPTTSTSSVPESIKSLQASLQLPLSSSKMSIPIMSEVTESLNRLTVSSTVLGNALAALGANMSTTSLGNLSNVTDLLASSSSQPKWGTAASFAIDGIGSSSDSSLANLATNSSSLANFSLGNISNRSLTNFSILGNLTANSSLSSSIEESSSLVNLLPSISSLPTASSSSVSSGGLSELLSSNSSDPGEENLAAVIKSSSLPDLADTSPSLNLDLEDLLDDIASLDPGNSQKPAAVEGFGLPSKNLENFPVNISVLDWFQKSNAVTDICTI